MTFKTVKHYAGFGSTTQTTLTIDDDGFGVINEEARLAFYRGQCHALALALNSLTGWQIKGVSRAWRSTDDAPDHCVVWCLKLRAYVDIKGAHNRAPKLNDSCKSRVVNRRLSARKVPTLDGYLKPNVKAAMPFARTILRDLGLL
jgi:hypothetical protein